MAFKPSYALAVYAPKPAVVATVPVATGYFLDLVNLVIIFFYLQNIKVTNLKNHLLWLHFVYLHQVKRMVVFAKPIKLSPK